MMPSSCPWRMRALGRSPAGSRALGHCTSSAGPGSRWLTRTSSPGCATRTWRMMRTEPRPLRSRMGESAPGIPAGLPSAAPSGPSAPSAAAPSAPTTPAAGEPCPLEPPARQPWLCPQSLLHTLPPPPSHPPCSLLPLSWTQHPLIQKNRRVVLASFLLLLLGLVLILVGVGLEATPSPGVSSAIFFVPGFLLLVPGVYHVIFIYCAVRGHRGFQFFYLPYFEK
ncbi:transmembrane protein 134 isoform X4 [Cebus imitator]|uniref:transmembrane protein 134 isoform X4 n=1 Tax=Cebus imitator TaxID=2715852 RepID=UPI000809F6EA|nr:transmembrane protein 134 isoform X4 [Cebus imitator]